MKHKRVIHLLADGRKKYSTCCGEMEMWSEADINSLKANQKKLGDAGYTLDFSRYDVEYRKLRKRYPRSKLIRVIGFEVEDHDLPINDNVIF